MVRHRWISQDGKACLLASWFLSRDVAVHAGVVGASAPAPRCFMFRRKTRLGDPGRTTTADATVWQNPCSAAGGLYLVVTRGLERGPTGIPRPSSVGLLREWDRLALRRDSNRLCGPQGPSAPGAPLSGRVASTVRHAVRTPLYLRLTTHGMTYCIRCGTRYTVATLFFSHGKSAAHTFPRFCILVLKYGRYKDHQRGEGRRNREHPPSIMTPFESDMRAPTSDAYGTTTGNGRGHGGGRPRAPHRVPPHLRKSW